jgi:hypothetical protein
MTLYEIFISFTLYPDIWKVEALALELFGGYTKSLATGQWRDVNNAVYNDRTADFKIVTDNTDLMDEFVRRAKDICQQKSVLVLASPVKATFV